MKIINTYSFKGGIDFIEKNHPDELADVVKAIESLNAIDCLTKESQEKTKKGKLLFSPTDLNKKIKTNLSDKGWTKRDASTKKGFVEPKHAFGGNRFREMDGMKNKVGLEVQFGKYAFMGYDIFSKMIIFRNLGYIECGIEVIPSNELMRQMSTGVSSFDQLMVDFDNRGEADIDVPVYVIGIGLTDSEKEETAKLQKLFIDDRDKALKQVNLRKYNGSPPGPK